MSLKGIEGVEGIKRRFDPKMQKFMFFIPGAEGGFPRRKAAEEALNYNREYSSARGLSSGDELPAGSRRLRNELPQTDMSGRPH